MIDLPLTPAPRSVTPIPVDFGAVLEGTMGGETLRVERQGSRWALQVEMPPMKHDADGRKFVARLTRGISEGARLDFPLLDFNPGSPGTVLVSGSGQSGTLFNVKNASPGYVFKEGQFINIRRSTRRYLYMVTSDCPVMGDGTAILTLWPRLRASHLDGDLVDVTQPTIEGYIQADQLGWEMALGNFDNLSFTIRESA